MGKGTHGLQIMREEFKAVNKGVAIPAEVQWLANRHNIRESRQYRESAALSVVIVVTWN